MNRLTNPLVLLAAAVAFLILSSAVFTVNERQTAIKLFLGEITRSDYEPGLHFKVPLLERVIKFDKRILTMDVPPEPVLTNEEKNVIVDTFVKWRIEDPDLFFTSVSGNEQFANARLAQFARESLRNAFGKLTIREVVSSARSTLRDAIREPVDAQAESLGIDIVDMRVKKVELPDDVRDSVYQRMQVDREKVAREIRSQGEESAKRIRAAADRIREETLATAYAEAEQTRGSGDAESARVYAEAYTQDPDFYALYRSLSAYRNAFAGNGDVLVLQPDSEFFQYFNGPRVGGQGRASGGGGESAGGQGAQGATGDGSAASGAASGAGAAAGTALAAPAAPAGSTTAVR